MEKIILSICISSFNKGNRCRQLVENILEIEDDRYNVFICDDCSEDETIHKLCLLKSSKVTLVQNKNNFGACKNWYRTIECGNGEYILHVLDRDDILVKSIKMIIDTLEKHPVGAGYIGKSAMSIADKKRNTEKYAVLKEGKDAFLTMAGVPVHPTGFLVKRTEWKNGNYKRFFYRDEKYGIYPHSYVLGMIALQNDMLYMPISFCNYLYRGENKQSGFYRRKDRKNYWWLPENVMETSNRMLLELYKYADKSCHIEFIIRRFYDGLYRATISYKNTVKSKKEMEHYGLDVREISNLELWIISFYYFFSFLPVIDALEINNKMKLKMKAA